MRHVIAKIRENECIGCTKCIAACPVDAISGAAKLMHTVIESECIGCELCLPPCPMDCIDLIPWAAHQALEHGAQAAYALERAQQTKQRVRARQQRLAQEMQEMQARYTATKNRLLPSAKP